MVKLVRESLDFERTGDIKKSLGLGREAFVRKFFRDLQIADNFYIIKDNGEVVYNTDLYLVGTKITELPSNLTINGILNVSRSKKLTKLPNNLTVKGDFSMNNTNITELPDDLVINGGLYSLSNELMYIPDTVIIKKGIIVNKEQTELIDFIRNSEFKYNLIRW